MCIHIYMYMSQVKVLCYIHKHTLYHTLYWFIIMHTCTCTCIYTHTHTHTHTHTQACVVTKYSKIISLFLIIENDAIRSTLLQPHVSQHKHRVVTLNTSKKEDTSLYGHRYVHVHTYSLQESQSSLI